MGDWGIGDWRDAMPCCSSDEETRKAEREVSEWQRLCWRVVAVAHQPSPNGRKKDQNCLSEQ
jgi:hypothetical protein